MKTQPQFEIKDYLRNGFIIGLVYSSILLALRYVFIPFQVKLTLLDPYQMWFYDLLGGILIAIILGYVY